MLMAIVLAVDRALVDRDRFFEFVAGSLLGLVLFLRIESVLGLAAVLGGHYEGTNHHGVAVVLDCVKELAAGESVDLTEDIQPNYEFFKNGPGYSAND